MQINIKKDGIKELLRSLFQYAVECETLKSHDCTSTDLDLLRQNCDEDKRFQKYQQIYFKAYLYKAIFTLFALIFLTLSLFALSQNLILTTALFGSLKWLPKMVIGIVSLSLAVAAIVIGKSICIAKESAMRIAEKANYIIQKMYHSEGEFINEDCLLRWQSKKKYQHSTYSNSLNAIKEKQEETIILLKKIQKSKDLTPSQKGMLFCQALQQMEKELQEIIEGSYCRLL